MKRSARLQSARKWLARFGGKRVVRAYAKWFGVDLECAIVELRLLGAPLDPAYVEQVMMTLRSRAKAKRVRAVDDHHVHADPLDGGLAFVAGYTTGGAAFGLSWEELHRAEGPRCACAYCEEDAFRCSMEAAGS